MIHIYTQVSKWKVNVKGQGYSQYVVEGEH